MIKECKKHGLTDHRERKDNKAYRCKKCAVEAVTKQRRVNKLKGISYKGGECSKCGYKKCADALDFHHIDPETKEFGLSGGSIKSWEKQKTELDKCILVCANCHREIHSTAFC